MVLESATLSLKKGMKGKKEGTDVSSVLILLRSIETMRKVFLMITKDVSGVRDEKDVRRSVWPV